MILANLPHIVVLSRGQSWILLVVTLSILCIHEYTVIRIVSLTYKRNFIEILRMLRCVISSKCYA